MSEVQLLQQELFALEEHMNEDFTNTFMSFDQLPFYASDRRSVVEQERPQIRQKTLNLGSILYEFNLHPASLLLEKKGIKSTVYRFPGTRERRVMEALKKIAYDHDLTYRNKHYGVTFTLRDLQRVISSNNSDKSSLKYNLRELREALYVLQGSNIEMTATDTTNGEFRSYRSPQLANLSMYGDGQVDDLLSEGDNEGAEAFNAYCFALFHPLITRDVNELSYRQINFKTLSSLKGAVAPTLYKHMALKYTQASPNYPYTIKLSTIRLWSGLQDDPSMSMREQRKPVIYGFEQLKEEGIIESYLLKDQIKRTVQGPQRTRKRVVDEIYVIKPSTSFVKEQKRANRIEADLQDRKELAQSKSQHHRRAVERVVGADFSDILSISTESVAAKMKLLRSK